MFSAGQTNPVRTNPPMATPVIFGEAFVLPDSPQYDEGASSYQRARRRGHLLAGATGGPLPAGVLGVISGGRTLSEARYTSLITTLDDLFARRNDPTTELPKYKFQEIAAEALKYLNSDADDHSKLRIIKLTASAVLNFIVPFNMAKRDAILISFDLLKTLTSHIYSAIDKKIAGENDILGLALIYDAFKYVLSSIKLLKSALGEIQSPDLIPDRFIAEVDRKHAFFSLHIADMATSAHLPFSNVLLASALLRTIEVVKRSKQSGNDIDVRQLSSYIGEIKSQEGLPDDLVSWAINTLSSYLEKDIDSMPLQTRHTKDGRLEYNLPPHYFTLVKKVASVLLGAEIFFNGIEMKLAIAFAKKGYFDFAVTFTLDALTNHKWAKENGSHRKLFTPANAKRTVITSEADTTLFQKLREQLQEPSKNYFGGNRRDNIAAIADIIEGQGNDVEKMLAVKTLSAIANMALLEERELRTIEKDMRAAKKKRIEIEYWQMVRDLAFGHLTRILKKVLSNGDEEMGYKILLSIAPVIRDRHVFWRLFLDTITDKVFYTADTFLKSRP